MVDVMARLEAVCTAPDQTGKPLPHRRWLETPRGYLQKGLDRAPLQGSQMGRLMGR